mmetsp:Transcript_22184/g.62956  ORF Transcript_22184/g.62956 Transcript_22184/m.62956 type:complete len:220 (-) Transcript_22184:1477-2136(-)
MDVFRRQIRIPVLLFDLLHSAFLSPDLGIDLGSRLAFGQNLLGRNLDLRILQHPEPVTLFQIPVHAFDGTYHIQLQMLCILHGILQQVDELAVLRSHFLRVSDLVPPGKLHHFLEECLVPGDRFLVRRQPPSCLVVAGCDETAKHARDEVHLLVLSSQLAFEHGPIHLRRVVAARHGRLHETEHLALVQGQAQRNVLCPFFHGRVQTIQMMALLRLILS